MRNENYKIVIENLEFDAIIGILDKERKKAQKVIVNAYIEYEKKDKFVDYAKVCEIIQKSIKQKQFLLIEDALEYIVNLLKETFPQIKSIHLIIKKPEILSNALVGVDILRKF